MLLTAGASWGQQSTLGKVNPTGSGASLTNLSGDAPWKMALIGVKRAQGVDYATTCDNTHPITNLNVGGAGVVTSIRMVFQSGAASAFPNITNAMCHILYDGGADVANFPWTYLIGVMLPRTNMVDVVGPKAETEFFTIADLQPGILDFEVSYPIPFTNGCTIWTTSTLGVNTGSRVDYQDALAATAFSGMRFKATNANVFLQTNALPVGTVGFNVANPTSLIGVGTHFDATNQGQYFIITSLGSLEIAEALVVTVTNATSALISWGTAVTPPVSSTVSGIAWQIPTPFNWLNRPGGSAGFVAAVLGSGTNWLVEPNMRWFVNQESTPAAEYWDTEQFFGGNDGFSFQPYQGREVGQISISSDQEYWAGYRLFNKTPIRYSNGIRMMVNHRDVSGTPFPSRMNFLTVFYE